MKILSCGAGMQSTALALMACEKVKHPYKYPYVPIYDAIIFCDLGLEPKWVYEQVDFISKACKDAGIYFKVLHTNLYGHYLEKFGKTHVVAIPFWTVDEDGKPGKMWMRSCTTDFKIKAIQNFVRWELLGYKKGAITKPEDKNSHEMHLGFSEEEKSRASENPHAMFINRFPLIEMGLTRADNYAYILDTWGLDTKASACTFCPFHTNFFFLYLRENDPDMFGQAVEFDEMLEREQPNTPIKRKIFISNKRKRILELTEEDCNDVEFFMYKNEYRWNGF